MIRLKETTLHLSNGTLRHQDTLLKGFSPLVEDSPDGSRLKILHNRTLRLPWKSRLEHLLVCGKTGSGKTTRLIQPITYSDIADKERTVVVVDAQASEVRRIIEYTRKVRGSKAKILYFNAQDPEFSFRWNPFAGITGRRDAYDLADTMSASTACGTSDSPHFRIQATKYLAAIVRAMNQVACGRATGGAIRSLIDHGGTAIRDLAEKSGVRELLSFSQNLQNGNRNDETTISELTNLLQPWNDEAVMETTGRDGFCFDILDDEPCVLIYAIPEESVERLRPLTNAFFHRFFNFVMRRGRENGGEIRRPLALIVDEFASAVGRLVNFPQRANTLRKRGLAITAAVQTLAQIDEVYGAAGRSLLAAFNHLILVPPVTLNDASYASNLSGHMTVNEFVTSDGYSPTSVIPSKRPVLTPEEVANPIPAEELGGPRITFLFAGTPAFQGWLLPTYQQPDYQEITVANDSGPLHLPAQERRTTKAIEDLSDFGNMENPGITNIAGWTTKQIEERLTVVRAAIGWEKTTGSVRRWWKSFEAENKGSLPLLLRFTEELLIRKATITEFFLAYADSNTGNLQANLHYLDYLRLKKNAPTVSK